MKLSNGLVVVALIGFVLTGNAQFSETDNMPPAATYLFPVKPGQPAALAGTMGELRSTHFHTGIDIRTLNEIGWPVRAANQGYISRITISPSGFGLVMYVKHPDGYTTVYGHLDKFKKEVDEYVRRERYRRKTSSIDLYFRKDQFKVNRGDTIAFSGNTGSSAGPHLHFDIRDENNRALDPLRFNFSEVVDNAPPVVRKVALRTLDMDARINDQFGRFEFYVTKTGREYVLPQPIFAHGNIGIEVLAYDVVDNPNYRCGVNYIEVYADSQQVFSQAIEQLNLNEGRSVFTVMDFKTLRTAGDRFYKLYVDDGNQLGFYRATRNGKITVTPDALTPVKIILSDAYGNNSTLRLTLNHSKPVNLVKWLNPVETTTYSIQENTWVITTKTCPKNTLAWKKGEPSVIDPAYLNSATTVYLIDLRNPLPDSVILCGGRVIPPVQARVYPGREYTFYSGYTDIQFPARASYDTLYFSTSYLATNDSLELFTIGDPNVPLRQSIKVTLKPNRSYTTPEKTSVYRKNGKGYLFEGGTWTYGKIQFTTRDFGTFTLLTDSIPPAITPLQVNRYGTRFKIRDNLSGIASIEATLGGQWLLMNYDEKSNTIESETVNKNTLLQGDFVLTITDNAGNQQVFKQTIN
ncbi:MAG: M23 family metallopeptidase [Flammeovirgaceae bacterium]|nr:MAG: M23 family metallopeptidase [Flammeovirgaceae bacterium]